MTLPTVRNELPTETLPSALASVEVRSHFYAWNPLLSILYIGAGDASKTWASGCFRITEEDLRNTEKRQSLEETFKLHGINRFNSAHALRVDATRLAYLPFAAPQLYTQIARTDTYAAPPERLRRHE